MSLKLNERYPGRFNNPSADYPDGSFKNRTAPAAKDGSYLEQDWANDREGFFQSLLYAAGIEANGLVDKVGSSQIFESMLHVIRNQTAQAFTTAGTSTALTLSPVPAISGYAVNQRFCAKFSVASGTNPTINISGRGAKFLKQYDATGAKIAAVFSSEQISDIVYDGVDCLIMDPLPSGNSAAAGIVNYYAASAAPSGYLKANGAVISRTTYAALFSAIGTTFGAGDGSTTFQLPDLRSEFIRAWDDGRGVDVGRVFGSAQTDTIQNITGESSTNPKGYSSPTTSTGAFVTVPRSNVPAGIAGGGSWESSSLSFDASRVARTSTETRPRNVALLACIKF